MVEVRVSILPSFLSTVNLCWSMTKSRSPSAYLHSSSRVAQRVSRRLPRGVTLVEEKRPSCRILEMSCEPSEAGWKDLRDRRVEMMDLQEENKENGDIDQGIEESAKRRRLPTSSGGGKVKSTHSSVASLAPTALAVTCLHSRASPPFLT